MTADLSGVRSLLGGIRERANNPFSPDNTRAQMDADRDHLLGIVERVEALADTFDGLGSHASYHGTEAEMETWLSAANHLRAAITGEGGE